MPFGFGKKDKDKRTSRDSAKHHEKKERESSRARMEAYEAERKEKEAVERKMREDKETIKKLSNDARVKNDQITQLQSTVTEKSTENEQLRLKLEQLDKQAKDLQNRIDVDSEHIKLEPAYFNELKVSAEESKRLSSELKKVLTKVSEIEEKEARISREKDEDNEKFKAEIAEIKEQFSKEIEKYKNKVDDLQGQVNASRDENATITANEKVLNGQFRVLRDEKNTLEYELKKTIQQNSDLEKELKDLRDELDRREQIDEMNSLSEKLSTVEDQLRDSILKNQQKDQIILDKTQEIENFQNDIYRMQNDMTEKDNQIEKQENMINDLKYKIKDDSERFESQFEETMTMHSRQLQSLRQSQDPEKISRLESDAKRLRESLKSEKDQNRNKDAQISELKTKCSRLELRSRISDDSEKLKKEINQLKSDLKAEKAARNEEKLNYETIVHNLRGHMLNIYAGNVSPEMAQILNTALEIERRKQQKIST